MGGRRLGDGAGATALMLALLVSGCLADTYTVRRGELERLAGSTMPERATRVRVVQNLSDDDDPPRASEVPPGHPHDPDSELNLNLRQGTGGDGAAAIVLAATGIAFIISESARFDGWVGLDASYPVHLWLETGQHMWVPLGELTPAHLIGAKEGVLYDDEGSFFRVERAPLDRVGLSFTFDMGTPLIRDDDSHTVLGRVGFGGFFLQQIGLLATFTEGPGSGFPRIAGEVDIFPWHLGILHTGIFFEPGAAWLRGPDGNDPHFYIGAGPLLQLRVTTRLALTLRATVATFVGPEETTHDLEWSAGIAVY